MSAENSVGRGYSSLYRSSNLGPFFIVQRDAAYRANAFRPSVDMTNKKKRPGKPKPTRPCAQHAKNNKRIAASISAADPHNLVSAGLLQSLELFYAEAQIPTRQITVAGAPPVG